MGLAPIGMLLILAKVAILVRHRRNRLAGTRHAAKSHRDRSLGGAVTEEATPMPLDIVRRLR